MGTLDPQLRVLVLMAAVTHPGVPRSESCWTCSGNQAPRRAAAGQWRGRLGVVAEIGKRHVRETVDRVLDRIEDTSWLRSRLHLGVSMVFARFVTALR